MIKLILSLLLFVLVEFNANNQKRCEQQVKSLYVIEPALEISTDYYYYWLKPQTGSNKLIIRVTIDQEPLYEARIKIYRDDESETSDSCQTNKNGSCTFYLKEGTYHIKVYVPQEQGYDLIDKVKIIKGRDHFKEIIFQPLYSE